MYVSHAARTGTLTEEGRELIAYNAEVQTDDDRVEDNSELQNEESDYLLGEGQTICC